MFRRNEKSSQKRTEPGNASLARDRETAEILRRTLSTSSEAESAALNPVGRSDIGPGNAVRNLNLTVIDRGTWGTVYEIPSTDKVLKFGSPSHDGIRWDFHAIKVACQGASGTQDACKVDVGSFSDIPVPRVANGFEYHRADDLEF